MPAMPRHVGGRTGEHGWQLDAVAGVEEAGGEGDADEVVAEGPHEVEPDAAHHHAREVEGRRHVGERALDEHDVGRLDGHIGAAADGDAHVGLRERGRVVDAVAHHGDDLAPCLQRLDLLLLLGGLDLRKHVRDADARGQVAHRPLVVARDAPGWGRG